MSHAHSRAVMAKMDRREAGQENKMNRHVTSISFTLIALMFLAAPTVSLARVQGPRLKGDLQARKAQILRGRSQRIKPQVRQNMVRELTAMKVDSAQFRQKISAAPLKVRLEVFKQMSAQGKPAATGLRKVFRRVLRRNTDAVPGVEPQAFDRRLRGMLKENGRNRVSKPHKNFVEVTQENFKLFQQVLGGNVVWFAVNSSPGHLHTLIGDQGKRGKFHHNVYGEGGSNTDAAKITGNFTQYAMPVVLTDRQMDRFTRYMNQGLKHHKHNDSDHSVYGFYAKGNKITDIKCTNWVTSAPVGNLPRWAQTLDKRLVKMGAAGQLGKAPSVVRKSGLHAALAGAGDARARKTIVDKVLKNPMSKWNRSAVKRMAKQFDKVTGDFPNRPADLVMRDALSKTLGLGRSKDPAKWSYDLMMSKKVPVVAVLAGSKNTDFAKTTFNMEIMGVVGANGKVEPNPSYSSSSNGNYGVVPADRQP